jgi:hypothetical protein
MAVGVYVAPANMSPQQYEQTLTRLQAAGAGQPKGRSYHVSFFEGDKLHVFDVWDSQEDFDTFGQTLLPILADLGIDMGQPSISPVHNVIKG